MSPAFAEDPVRILRVARFAARFGFAVAPETLALMQAMVQRGEADALVPERVWQEARARPHGEEPDAHARGPAGMRRARARGGAVGRCQRRRREAMRVLDAAAAAGARLPAPALARSLYPLAVKVRLKVLGLPGPGAARGAPRQHRAGRR